MSDRPDNPLHGFGLPPAPDGLREASLRAALAAFTAAPPPDLWTRLVRSRTVRLAWAASVTLLLVLHLALPRRAGKERLASPDIPRLDPEISSVVALPRIDEQALVPFSGAPS
jgi:hypothetical protein